MKFIKNKNDLELKKIELNNNILFYADIDSNITLIEKDNSGVLLTPEYCLISIDNELIPLKIKYFEKLFKIKSKKTRKSKK